MTTKQKNYSDAIAALNKIGETKLAERMQKLAAISAKIDADAPHSEIREMFNQLKK